MSSRARPASRVPALVLALAIGLGAPAAAAGAEGAGYDGAGSGLRVRVVEAAEAAGSPQTAGSDASSEASSDAGPSSQTVEVRGSGFLANSAVTVRVAGGGAVRASADEVGSVVARVRLRGDVGGRVWITATGTDPSFQRRVVTDHLAVGSDQTPVSPTTALLGAAGACIAASAGVGMVRRRAARPEAAS